MADLKHITFNGNRSDIPDTYTKTETDRLIAVERGDRVAADLELQGNIDEEATTRAEQDALLQARVDNIIAAGGSENVTTLWTGSIGKKGTSATLSQNVSNFDFIDIYTGDADTEYLRIPTTRTTAQLQGQNLSDDASVTFLAAFETGLTISGTTISVTKNIYWLWNPPNSPVVTDGSDDYITITRIDGIKYELPAELTDIRVGADGTVYQTAGDAVRGQISDLKEDLSDLGLSVVEGKLCVTYVA